MNMNKQTIITVLLALVAMAGQGQVKPDTITINFQLSSKVQGEKATVVYPDFMTFDTSVCTDSHLPPTSHPDVG